MGRTPLARGAAALLTAAASALFFYLGALGGWDLGVCDRFYQKPSVTNKKIYIIAIDDKTLDRYGPVNTWSRDIPARLVELLSQDPSVKPAVIGFDIIYSERGDKEGDDRFARACAAAGNVVTALSFSFKEVPKQEGGRVIYDPYHIESIIGPYDSLRDAAAKGYANTTVDPDGRVRQVMAWQDYEGERVYSLSAEIYRRYEESQGREALFPPVTPRGNRCYFSYSGKPGGYNVVSMADVLDGTVDARLFQDAMVLVGAYAVGMQDAYTPAISHNSQMYGVEIHANIIQALMEGKTQLPVSPLLYGGLAGILCGLFFLGTSHIKITRAFGALAVLILSDLGIARLLYHRGILVPVTLVPVVLSVLCVFRILEGYLAERKRRRRVVNVFKQYVAPQVVDKISRDADFKLVLGGENRHIAVLFVDIRGFTTMSESLMPEEVVEILNQYLALTTKAIFDNGGTLDKFVGDAAMAVFNAPFDLDDYIFRAVKAAWDMKEGARGLSEVAFGIGVNCGNAVVGNIGCQFRMDYTAIGDTVNTAARLESSAKAGQILISQQVYDNIKDRVDVTPMGEIPLKGKSNGVFVYQVDKVRG